MTPGYYACGAFAMMQTDFWEMLYQRWIRPEPSPPASFSTSETVIML